MVVVGERGRREEVGLSEWRNFTCQGCVGAGVSERWVVDSLVVEGQYRLPMSPLLDVRLLQALSKTSKSQQHSLLFFSISIPTVPKRSKTNCDCG